MALLFLAAAQYVKANHSTCSWIPLKSYADPPDEGWRKFCTATLQDGGRYACGAYWPGSASKVADYGVLAHNVLELGEFDLVPNTWECMRLFADQCWAPRKHSSHPVWKRWLRWAQDFLEKQLHRSNLAHLRQRGLQ